MGNFSKLIDDAFSCIDWSLVLQFYNENEYSDKYHKKRINVLQHIKNDLRNLCNFVIDNNLNYFDQDQFIIRWNNMADDSLGDKLEILFVPVRGCSFTNEPDLNYIELDKESGDLLEYNATCDLLEDAIRDENYELAAVLRDRIKALDKYLNKTYGKQTIKQSVKK